MPNRRYNFSIADEPLYPHIKLTDEEFPRLLSTRRIEDDGAEYFGPFLTRSAARILIDFLNATFRLRSCTIEVDGSFETPCTQYYAKRCLAPCVSSLCGTRDYAPVLDLVRVFLQNDMKEFEMSALALIDSASEQMNFERAAFFRDILQNVQAFWSDKRRHVWLDDAVDTFVIEVEDNVIRIYVVTTRRARTLGSRVFVFPFFEGIDACEVLRDVIIQFYRANIPREIRVPFDFEDRRDATRELRRKVGRPAKIVVEGPTPERITALKALARTKLDAGLESLKPVVTPAQIGKSLKKLFGLKRSPSRIEAFDAAHISGSFATAGMSVWENGRLITDQYRASSSEHTSELATLGEFIDKQFAADKNSLPGMILVDGGKGHVNAALTVLSKLSLDVPVVGAVKPRGKHGEMSHFLTSDGRRIDFNPSVAAMRVLKLLRDEAHDLANAAHGQSRDKAHFYELAGILPSLNEKERQILLARFGSIRKIIEAGAEKIAVVIGSDRHDAIAADLKNFKNGRSKKNLPLIVPVRYDDPNGLAGDLRPIKSANRSRRSS